MMKAIFIESQNINKLTEAFNELNSNSIINTILVLMADLNQYNKDEIEPLLKSSTKTILGGVFPEIIHKGHREPEGVLLIPSKKHIQPQLLDLSDSLENNLTHLQNKFDYGNIKFGTAFIFMHGFGSKTNFLGSIFNYFGTKINYLGAGSGSVVNIDIPSIFSNKGLHHNAGIIGLTEEKIKIGIGHGWKIISETIKITKSEGGKIINLDWQPAFEVYKKIVEKHSGNKFTSSNYNEIAKCYPFGIAKIDAEMLIRDPLILDGTALVTSEKIEEGEYINILFGEKKILLEGAKKARDKIFEKGEHKHTFCIDCFTRLLFLKEELEIINKNGDIDGVISIGEIGNNGESFLESYNKTIVIAQW